MNNPSGVKRSLFELLILSILILFLVLVIDVLMPVGPAMQVPSPPATQTALAKETSSFRAGTEIGAVVTKPAGGVPYPPPETVLPEAGPQLPAETLTVTVPASPTTPPLPAGQAATLYDGDIWLVEPGTEPIKLTEFGDVSTIFDWNSEGSRLLFGRGQNTQAWGTTTELWLLDLNARDSSRLTKTGEVKSASWSPVDDRLAYCEYGNVLRIVNLDGQLLNERDQSLCMFTWSPDGTAIALETYTPDMLDSDGLANTVLGVWSLQDDRLQVFSQARDEVHASPVWSIDGRQIMFDRIIYDTSEADLEEQGLYLADLATGQIQLLLPSPRQAVIGLIRSPRADQVVYRLGQDVYVMDFAGHQTLVGQADPPYFTVWLEDGKTLLLHDNSGGSKPVFLDFTTTRDVVGGWLPTMGQFIYYFKPGG